MTNEFITMCDTCGKKTWYSDGEPCHCTYPKKDTCTKCGRSETVEPYQEIRCKGTLRMIDTSELDKRFTPYYENKKRIEVTYEWGEKERFTVGKSTGRKPIYLAIKRINSIGGVGILTKSVVSIREV